MAVDWTIREARRPNSLVAAVRLAGFLGLCVALGTSQAPSSADAANISFAVESASVQRGQTASIAIAGNVSGTSLGSWTLDIQYDPGLLKVSSCRPAYDGLCNPQFSPGMARVTGVSLLGVTGQLRMVEIEFATREVDATAVVQVNATQLADQEGRELHASSTTVGFITIQQGSTTTTGLWGDVQCDSDVDMADSDIVLRYSAGLSYTQVEPCADLGTMVTIKF